MAASIPYDLCRGFGMQTGKAFFLTFILFYILSWVKFPQAYHFLADRNLGLVNLALLIFFFFAVFKLIKFRKSTSYMVRDLERSSPYNPEIDNEIEMQDKEKKTFKRQAKRITNIEIQTIDDITEALAEIQHIVETHKNNLPTEERQRIAQILQVMLKKEDIFKKSILNLQRIFQSTGFLDEKQLQELKKRMSKSSGEKRKNLKVEIEQEEEKLKIEKVIYNFEIRLGQYLDSFNKLVMTAIDRIKVSPYPYDAKTYLSKARVLLKDILKMLKETKALEKRLIRLTNIEKKFLKKEK